jgi:hypothetical protein
MLLRSKVALFGTSLYFVVFLALTVYAYFRQEYVFEAGGASYLAVD